MKKTISIVLVIAWMIVIFCFSSVGGTKSSNSSSRLIKNTVKITSNVLYKIRVIKKPLSDAKIEHIAKKYNFLVRKLAHVLEYTILALLIYNALYQYKIKYSYLMCFILSVLYAITDEIHQLFTARSGKISDVAIDSIGILLALLIIYFLKYLKNIFKKTNK